jgi:hypothetical protein
MLFSSINEWRHGPEQQQLAKTDVQQLTEQAPS